MKKEMSYEILNNPKLLKQLLENSYYIKQLNRDTNNIKIFKKDMKTIYKERTTDKINEVIDGIDMISTIIDTVK